MKIAIQGELGSFSHQAATEMLSKAQVVPCTVSRIVFEALDSARAQGMPWVIVVNGTTTPGGRVFSQTAATASLDIRALEAQSGAVAASSLRQGKGFGSTAEAAQQAAANEAGAAAAADLADALVAKEKAGL